jgi:hypothetical protein
MLAARLTNNRNMFENIRTGWQEARAARLKEEFLDASRRMNSFTEENAEHFARTLDYAFRYWITEHGPVKECAIEFRRSAVKELQSQARQRYNTDVGAAYGLAVFSFHVEASFLPGEDGSFVYDLTTLAISKAGELVHNFPKTT